MTIRHYFVWMRIANRELLKNETIVDLQKKLDKKLNAVDDTFFFMLAFRNSINEEILCRSKIPAS